jgi:RNA ligase (TIGR02306 family)
MSDEMGCVTGVVKKVERIKISSKRYDITVSKNHNFFANGLCVHNCSSSYFLHKTKRWGVSSWMFGVCSRNIWMKTKDNSNYWGIAKKYDLEKRLCSLKEEVVVQGEICGPKIQGNKYGLKENDFFVFNVLMNGKRFSANGVQSFCRQLGLKTVPYLKTNSVIVIKNAGSIGDVVREMVAYADAKSVLADVPREGIVCRLSDNPYVSFKIINPNFLLKYGE